MTESNQQLIEEFDKEVEMRCNIIRNNMENVCQSMLNSLELTLFSIPSNVKQLTMKELMEQYDGDIQKASNALNNRSSANNINVGSITPRNVSTPQKKNGSQRGVVTPTKNTVTTGMSSAVPPNDSLKSKASNSNLKGSALKTSTKSPLKSPSKVGTPQRGGIPTPKTNRRQTRSPVTPRKV